MREGGDEVLWCFGVVMFCALNVRFEIQSKLDMKVGSSGYRHEYELN